jgi:hypothetical protein
MALLITPIKYNDLVIGAIEMASLSPIAEYKRLFVEKIAESIASNFSTINANGQNKRFFIAS